MVTHGFRNQTNVPAQNHNCNAKSVKERLSVEHLSPENVAKKLTSGQTLQLLMTLKDTDLVYLIDKAARERRIKSHLLKLGVQ